MNVATKSIAEAPTSSDPAPPTIPEPSTREIIRNLTRELREDVGEQAVETVVAANPLVGLDRSQTLAAGTRVLGRALLEPAQLARRLAGLLGEIALVLAGRSDRKPDPADRRFLDETWRDHPLYRRWMQAYLASRDAVLGLVDEVDLDEKSRERGNYWVNNYLLGNAPPAFDILYWNADSTNLPATLHAQFTDLFVKNHLLGRGTLTVLGTPIDLRSVRSDVYTVGAVTDHITPWHAVYRTPRLFGGTGTFVLSSSGHIQAIVNPPGNPKAKYFVGPEKLDADPEKWRRAAEARAGSWWEHWAAWLADRSGERRPAPRRLGSDAHPEIAPAPGSYVHQRADG
jgi:hypothetical protein